MGKMFIVYSVFYISVIYVVLFLRSLTKWLVLGVILLLLSFLLGFVWASALLVRSFVRSPRPRYCLSSLLDLLHISDKLPDLPKAVY